MRVQFECIESLRVGPSFTSFGVDDLPRTSYKNASLSYVESKTTPYVRNILRHMPFGHKHKRILIDIKVHHLECGMFPANPGWHIDGKQNIIDAQQANNIYHIFLCSQSCLTEFLPYPVERDVCPDSILDYNMLFSGIEGVSIPSNTICTYSVAPHRARAAAKKETRLLIRAVETNHILPRNRSFQVLYKSSSL